MLARRAAIALGIVVALCSATVWLTVLRSDSTTGTAAPGHLADCEPRIEADWSIARTWNEALLSAIRLDFPAPTVHARNLFHTSAAMWDAWAAYDPTAVGVFVDEQHGADDLDAARREAISFAAYRVLVARYLRSPGAEESVTGFDRLLADLCFDREFTTTEGGTPAALGNRVAARILAESADDGSNEADGYTDATYEPVNPPLVVVAPGAVMTDPNRWQPLELETMVSQTGIPLTETRQTFIGSHWGHVEPFALGPAGADGLPIDPGPPPSFGDVEFVDSVVEVLTHSATLDPRSDTMIDIGPATSGNAPIGSYDDRGHEKNPATGRSYAPNLARLGDYSRVVAEYWADGPSSETPPGHWNTIANSVTDSLDGALRIGGSQTVGPLEWDVKLYLAINGAAHDAAISAWGAKGHYDYVRPISMVRWMGGHGQSSDPDARTYDPDGLPLVPGLIEVASADSTTPGARHEHLADHVGEVVVRAWRGAPSDTETELGGVGWIRAVEWVPYQLPTFVTPSFAAYVSGHSTFSRAAAEVLTSMTGSEFFPGGLGEWTVPAGALEFEAGPADDLTLQWATYADAADEAGRSRLYGGIHVRADDLQGRLLGLEVGRRAWNQAQEHFDGTADDN